MKAINNKKIRYVRCRMVRDRLIYQTIMDETAQAHSIRIPIYKKLEGYLKRPVISLYHNFNSSADLEDVDVDFLEGILRSSNLNNGAALIINSPGGQILAAERMIKNLRMYCGERGYFSIVPKMAMSAAAMVCLGSSKIIMGPSSSLGPIDPQIREYNYKTRQYERYSAFNILKSYEDLFKKAENLNKRLRLEPYLQALEEYNPKTIEEYKSIISLSKDIATNVLKTGMLVGKTEEEIEDCIRMFLTPEITKIHERCIYPPEAEGCGLRIDTCDIKSEFWKNIIELNLRLEHYMRLSNAGSVIETKDDSYIRPLEEEEVENDE